jgi:8-oxo-dGTP pyrophosphatase MutT (NUDIX family)
MKVREDVCRMPDGRIVDKYYIIEYADWVSILPLTSEMDVILIRQYRHGLGRTILEFPCGLIENDETNPENAALRELEEETGYTSERLIPLPPISPNASSNNNLSYPFIALDVRKVSEQNLDIYEEIEVVPVPFAKLMELAVNGEIPQTTHLANLFLAQAKLAELGILSSETKAP